MPALRLLLLALLATVAHAADDFLPPEQAYRYTVDSDGREIVVHWDVEKGYYLYKKRMGVETPAPGAKLGEPVYPKGEMHTDEYFGEQEIFRGRFDVRVPIVSAGAGAAAGAATTLPLALKFQGCADAGLCYPPTTWTTSVSVPATAAPTAATSAAATSAAPLSGIDAAFANKRAAAAQDDFLSPDNAFRLNAIPDGADRVKVVWEIAKGYYLYRDRTKFAVADGAPAQLGAPNFPEGEIHTDEYFGEQVVYYDELAVTVPVSRAGGAAMTLPFAVTYQGCAEAGLCYPPITKTLQVELPGGGSAAALSAAAGAAAAAGPGADAGAGAGGGAKPYVSAQDRLAGLVRSGNVFLMLGLFFGAGLLLAFTPCVLPMVPILSGIIAGQGQITTRRAFLLSLAYVLGMAFTYTLAGIAAAAAGAQVQAMFQQTWIIVLFALLFVVLALSMFGLFTIQMPGAIQSRLADASNQQKAGTFGGVAIMGALSALIVTTCVAPALVAALAVIGQSGQMVRGGAALFAMSLGMGAPLLLVGASAGKLLPKAGPWMDTVKQLFGVMFLLVAAWMLARVLPARVALLLWAIPALAAAWVLLRAVGHAKRKTGLRIAGGLAGAYGLLLLVGAAMGGTDPLRPLPIWVGEHRELEFRTIKSVEDLQREVAAASAAGRPLMLDFYADWCVSCKEMEKYTFTDPAVHAALANAVLLRADVTANDEVDQALLKHFGIYGPPTIAFYGPDGLERANYRVVGFMKAPEFAKVSAEAIAAATP